MKARALFVDHTGALGGAELALLEVATALRSSSSFVLFDQGPFAGLLRARGVNVIVLQGSSALHAVRRETKIPSIKAFWNAIVLAWRLSRIAREHDFIHANSQKAFVVSCLAGVLARRPVIWDLNDILTTEHFSATNIRLDIALANRVAARVLANSRASADAFVAQGGNGAKVWVVYNGIDPAPFEAVTTEDLARIREGLGVGAAPVLGLFGRLAPWKGQHVAIEALQGLPDAHLILVGEALFGEADYVQELHQLVRRHRLEDRVHFMGFRSDIPQLMRASTLILHASTSPEPFGRVIVEGMLAGRAVVVTKGGGVEEIVEDGVTGVTVPPGDPMALANTVSRLLADGATTEAIASRGHAAAKERFGVPQLVSTMSWHMEAVAGRARLPES